MRDWLSKLNDPILWALTIVWISGAWVGIYLQEATNNASLALLSVSGLVAGLALSWTAFKRAKAQKAREAVPVAPTVSETPILDDAELLEWFQEQKCCPDCAGTEFHSGPRGGGAQNVLCAGCHSEFNFGFPLFVHRNGEPGKGCEQSGPYLLKPTRTH